MDLYLQLAIRDLKSQLKPESMKVYNPHPQMFIIMVQVTQS